MKRTCIKRRERRGGEKTRGRETGKGEDRKEKRN